MLLIPVINWKILVLWIWTIRNPFRNLVVVSFEKLVHSLFKKLDLSENLNYPVVTAIDKLAYMLYFMCSFVVFLVG